MLLFPPAMVLTQVDSCPLAMSSQHVHPLKLSYQDLFRLCDVSLDWEGDIHSTSTFQSQNGIVACKKKSYRVLSLKNASSLWLT